MSGIPAMAYSIVTRRPTGVFGAIFPYPIVVITMMEYSIAPVTDHCDSSPNSLPDRTGQGSR